MTPQSDRDHDRRFRAAVGAYLAKLGSSFGDDVPWSALTQGFQYEGETIPLLGASGIWKPAVLPEMPISITTSPPRPGHPPPYADRLGEDDVLFYRYRGTDPKHRDNLGLRTAMQRGVPLAYFHGTARGWYAVAFPVFIIGDDQAALTFRVAVDTVADRTPFSETANESDQARRAYVTRVTRQRLHQQGFRRRVLVAYRTRCTICSLRREQLLDAAHILPDRDPRSEPVVSNGLSMCKLHHAAFDANLLGVAPDLTVDLRLDVLRETDGPMLLHGLQGFQGKPLHLPSHHGSRPNLEFLEERYRLFKQAV